MYSTTHFIPLIGSFYLAQEKYNNEVKNILEDKYIFSFDCFSKNKKHLINNRNKDITYLDLSYIDDSYTIDKYKEYIKFKDIKSTNIQLSIPPCGGLSLLNSANRSAESKTNRFIFEAVKWYIAQDNDVLILENAPAIVSKEGTKILDKIKEILVFNNRSKDKINVIKVNTINYGLPQYRGRSFILISKKDKSFKLKNYNQSRVNLEEYLSMFKSDDTTIVENTYVKKLLTYISKYDIVQQIKELNKNKSEYAISTINLLLKEFEKDPSIFDDDLKIKTKILYIKSKIDANKGFWDISPYVIKGKINAICGKSIYNSLNPIANEMRPFTVKELMYLMGMPKDFNLEDPKKNINHICQAIPVNTAMTAIKWGIDILENNVLENNIFEFTSNHNYIIQDHMKSY